MAMFRLWVRDRMTNHHRTKSRLNPLLYCRRTELCGDFLKTGTNPYSWPYSTQEAGSWPITDPRSQPIRGRGRKEVETYGVLSGGGLIGRPVLSTCDSRSLLTTPVVWRESRWWGRKLIRGNVPEFHHNCTYGCAPAFYRIGDILVSIKANIISKTWWSTASGRVQTECRHAGAKTSLGRWSRPPAAWQQPTVRPAGWTHTSRPVSSEGCAADRDSVQNAADAERCRQARRTPSSACHEAYHSPPSRSPSEYLSTGQCLPEWRVCDVCW